MSTIWPPIRLPLQISPQVVQIVRVPLDLPVERWSSLREHLTADECVRCDRFRIEALRRRFTICRTTLRRILGSCLGMPPTAVPITYANHGKPLLQFAEFNATMPRIEFNVSHSGDLGLIAFGLGAWLGVDVEECDPKVKRLELAKRYFSPVEAEQLFNLPVEYQLPGFYRGWTSKEAYIKATGKGMSAVLSSFQVMIDPRSPAKLLHVDGLPDEPGRWTSESFEVGDGFAATAMIATPDCRFETYDWIE